jgi:hypothetical protein
LDEESTVTAESCSVSCSREPLADDAINNRRMEITAFNGHERLSWPRLVLVLNQGRAGSLETSSLSNWFSGDYRWPDICVIAAATEPEGFHT